ncbi:GNAT family N-acetyltransferase [Arthrobacter cheniae]|uniref:GNAT family N-acetyltransferase n=1 Tax=Arthrobacter cheniae TaxID=1258888 RepID=A0A3A5LXA4_9MICC|nr:GNAT family N-acetyltransferase [Arthrobacter cheniae]RJT75655.1 GNAT family N-acetyltransferase [Arthrobacter cheniae]
MLVRPATPDDEDGVETICAASGRDTWNLNTLLMRQKRLVVVAEVGGQVVGVAKTHFHEEPDHEAPAGHYLGGVMVKPDRRRRGIALALTEARMKWIWARDDRSYYFTNEHNAASIRLHATFGFRALGRFVSIHGVTADNGQSDLILFASSR